MKKLYSTAEYKRKNKRRLKSLKRRKAKDKKRPKPFLELIRLPYEATLSKEQKREGIKRIRPTVTAPSDFRLVENTEDCLSFFKQIRSSNNNMLYVKLLCIILKSVVLCRI